MDGVAEQGKHEENVKCNVSTRMDALVINADDSELDDAPDHGEGDLVEGRNSQLRQTFTGNELEAYNDHSADVAPGCFVPT
jgi:hypothetical protein